MEPTGGEYQRGELCVYHDNGTIVSLEDGTKFYLGGVKGDIDAWFLTDGGGVISFGLIDHYGLSDLSLFRLEWTDNGIIRIDPR